MIAKTILNSNIKYNQNDLERAFPMAGLCCHLKTLGSLMCLLVIAYQNVQFRLTIV